MATLAQETLQVQRPVYMIQFHDAFDSFVRDALDGTAGWADGGDDRTITFDLSGGQVRLTVPGAGTAGDSFLAVYTPATELDLSDKGEIRLTVTPSSISVLDYLGSTALFQDFEDNTDWAAVLAAQNLGDDNTAGHFSEGTQGVSYDKNGTHVHASLVHDFSTALDFSDYTTIAFDIYIPDAPTLAKINVAQILLGTGAKYVNYEYWETAGAALVVGRNTCTATLSAPTGNLGAPDQTDINYIRVGVNTNNAADAFTGVVIDNFRAIDERQLKIRYTDSKGNYTEYIHDVDAEATLLDSLTASGSSGTMHWEDVKTITISGRSVHADGLTIILEDLTSKVFKKYSTHKFKEGAQLISEGADFEDSGGTLTGDAGTGSVADGWRVFSHGKDGGTWQWEANGAVLPTAEVPAWTNWTTGGAIPSVDAGRIKFNHDGVNNSYYSTDPIWPAGNLATNYGWDGSGFIYIEAEVQTDQVIQAGECKIDIGGINYRVQVDIYSNRIYVSSGTLAETFYIDMDTSAHKIGVTVNEANGAVCLYVDGVLEKSGTATASGGGVIKWGATSIGSSGVPNCWFDDVRFHYGYVAPASTLATDLIRGGNEQAAVMGHGGSDDDDVYLETDSADRFYLSDNFTYELLFWARCSVAKTIPIKIIEASGSTTLASTTIAIAASSTNRQYRWAFTPSAIDDDCSIRFELGDLGPFTFYISECRIHRAYPDASIKMGYLSKIKGSKQHTNPETGVTQIPAISFDLLDKNDEILDLQIDYEIEGQQVTLQRGYPNYGQSDFITANIFRADKVRLQPNGVAYTISCPVDLDRLKTPVMDDATAASTVVIGSGDGSGFSNLIDIFMQLATSDGTGTNGSWDTLPAARGAGIDIARFDIAEIATERDDNLSAWTGKFTITDRIKNFKEWCDREIFKVCGAYIYITDEGLISIKARQSPLWDASVATLTESEIVEAIPKWERNMAKGVVNRVTFYYDYDEANKEFDTNVSYDDDRIIRTIDGKEKTSQDLYGIREMVIKSQGIQSAVSTGMLEARAKAIFKRYAAAPPKITCKIDPRRGWIELGRLFAFSHSALPDLEAGVRGYVDKLLEVESAAPNFKDGTWALTLIESGYRRSKTGKISSLAVEFSAAAEAQKRVYVWISGTNNLFADGTDTYVVA